MKYSPIICCSIIAVLTSSASSEDKDAMDKIKIKVGGSTAQFTATLSDNPTASAFRKMLPLTINMTELNGNEKYGELASSLPVNSSVPKTISNGDLRMYGSTTLVLFYKTFLTSYRYTSVGQIDDAVGLAAALGAGDVVLTFEVK
ncbi:MAG: hypothetical protein JSS79_18775 [Bacteroidetes bacterium]|nr:hypothetical protein [Bacteroidota bacterium]